MISPPSAVNFEFALTKDVNRTELHELAMEMLEYIQSLERKLTETEEDRAGLEIELESAEGQVASHEAILRALHDADAVAQLQAQVRGLTVRTEAAEARAAELQTELDAAGRLRTQQATTIDELTRARDTERARAATAKARVLELEERLLRLEDYREHAPKPEDML